MSLARVLEVVFILFLITRFSDIVQTLTDEQRHQLNNINDLQESQARIVSTTPVRDASIPQLNLTGIRPYEDSQFFPHDIEDSVKSLWSTEQTVDPSVFYTNVSSYLHGTYRRTFRSIPEHMSMPLDGIMDPREPSGAGNKSISKLKEQGSMLVSMGEQTQVQGIARLVQAFVLLGPQFTISLKGVYTDHGHLVMATHSLKFSGYPAVPYLFPTNATEDARQLINADLNKTTYNWNDAESFVDKSRNCEFVLWGHVHSTSLHDPEELDAIEHELQHPRGRPVGPYPPVQLSGTLWSPDCGWGFDIDVEGERVEYYTLRARRIFTLFLGSLLGLVALGVNLRTLCTPSRAFHLSFWSVGMQALMDGGLTIVAMFMSTDSRFVLVMTAIAICALSLTALIDIQLLVVIFTSQRSEGGTAPPEPMSDQQVRSSIYSRFYACTVLLLMMVFYTLSAGDSTRRICEYILSLGMYSYWVPQIYRNARRGSPGPYSVYYIIAVSVLRLWPVLYVCFVPGNIAYHRHASRLGWGLIGWQWAQIALLIAQCWLGSLFPGRRSGYDYHRLLVQSDPEAQNDAEAPPTILADSTATLEPQPDPELGVRCLHMDCAICMNDVCVPVVSSEESAPAAAIVERQKYMITPCRHVFHTECLEQWLQSRLQCPVCRCPVPPI